MGKEGQCVEFADGMGDIYTGGERVYAVTVPHSGQLQVSVVSDFDAAVLITSALDESTVVGFADSCAPGAEGCDPNVEVASLGGSEDGAGADHTYFIIVDGFEGEAGTFTLNIEELAPFPRPLKPANREVVPTLRPSFSWTAVAGAERYVIQISNAPPDTNEGDFDEATIIISEQPRRNRFTPTVDLAPGTQYFWHVAAVQSGSRGFWSNFNQPTVTFFTTAGPR